MTFCVSLCICLLTLVACQGEINMGNDEGFVRRRRSLNYLIKLGDEAAETLMKGASRVYTRSKNYQKYVKVGTAQTALKEFESLKPTVIKNYQSIHGEDVVIGKVGQRTITLKKADRTQEGSPTIMIYDPRRGLRGYDKIVYQPERTGNY